MTIRKSCLMLMLLLAAALAVQPVLSAGNTTQIVTNYTADLQNDTATKFFNYAQQSLTLNDYASALKFYDQALAANQTMLKKTDALLYLYQGKAFALIQLGNFTDAVKTIDTGLSQYPNDAMLWNNRGYALSQSGDLTGALTAYDRAIANSGNYTKAFINKGDLLLRMGKFTDAAAAYSRANETDPFNIAAADGLKAAQAGESKESGNTVVILAVIIIIAAGVAVWYVKIRKPAEPAPDEKKKKSKKK